MTTVFTIIGLFAIIYLSIGLGVSMTLRADHRSRLMGGPPPSYYLLAIVAWKAILNDFERAASIRAGTDIKPKS